MAALSPKSTPAFCSSYASVTAAAVAGSAVKPDTAAVQLERETFADDANMGAVRAEIALPAEYTAIAQLLKLLGR